MDKESIDKSIEELDAGEGTIFLTEEAFLDSLVVLGKCPHGVDLDKEFCPEGCRV